ncbi:DUF523 domain-containing protein [Roseburia hominis]
MKVLVSSCVMGKNCKYNGGNNYNPKVMEFLRDKDVIEICPELLANLPIPRPSAELVDGVVMNINGENVDKEYRHAVEISMKEIEHMDIDLAILQSRSPTCGVNQVYDGSFTGKLVKGQGVFAQALIRAGYKVIDSEDF